MRTSRHDNQEGFPWSLEGLPIDQIQAIQDAVDRADAEFSAEIERIRNRAFKASQQAANKLRLIKAQIYAPYRIRPTQNPQEGFRLGMTRAMKEILEDVTTNGPQRYNGLMEKPIRALERLGLVDVVYDFLPSAIGRGRRVFEVSRR